MLMRYCLDDSLCYLISIDPTYQTQHLRLYNKEDNDTLSLSNGLNVFLQNISMKHRNHFRKYNDQANICRNKGTIKSFIQLIC